MKKQLLIAGVVAATAASTFAQGFVTFSTGSGKVKYTLNGGVTTTSVPTGNPDNIAGYGQVRVALYAAAEGTTLGYMTGANSTLPDLSAWTISAGTAQNVAPSAGAMTSYKFQLGAGTAGANEEVELVAWTGTATSWAQAVANADNGNALLAWSGSVLDGGAFGWDQPTATSTGAQTITAGTGGFSGTIVLAPVPEPGTIALGGLGAAALLLFRRRK